jgi:hypothetical protein
MTIPPLIIGPVPPESNPPIEPQYYKPRVYFIMALSFGMTTLVTTTINHDYEIGQLVRLIIPSANGSRALNNSLSYIISIPALNQFVLSIASIGVDPFITTTNPNQPQTLAIGNVNTGNIGRHGRAYLPPFIPGSFRDISTRGNP